MRRIRIPVLAATAALLLWLPSVSAEEGCKEDESVSENTKGDCAEEEEVEVEDINTLLDFLSLMRIQPSQ